MPSSRMWWGQSLQNDDVTEKAMPRQKLLLLFTCCLVCAPGLYAQDANEFQRVAKRIMDAYDIGEELQHAPDSGNFYGGAYLGASSNGRAMPSGYFTYLKDKLLFTSRLSVDFSDQSSEKDVSTKFTSGADQTTASDMLTQYERVDFSTRLDYASSGSSIFSIGLLESYNYKRENEHTVKNGHDVDGNSLESRYEEQHRSNRDLKLGGLLQYIYDVEKAGRLTTRLNLKYNYKPTTVSSDVWAARSELSLREQEQTLYNFDPYAMVRFESKAWGGFKFRVEEKYTLENMRIKDTETAFNFKTYSLLSTAYLTYAYAGLSLNANLRYEHFITDLDDHETATRYNTYNDWMLSLKATLKAGKRSKFVLSFDRDIQRPTYTQLYPFIHIGSSIGVMVVGNPALQPLKNNQVKFSHTYTATHWKLTNSLAYMHTSDDISQVSSYDELSYRSVKTWVNDADYYRLRYAAGGEVRYGAFSTTAELHAQYLDYDGESISTDQSFSWNFKLQPQMKVGNDWTLSSVLHYTGRETHLYYYNNSTFYWSLRAVKQIGKWALYAFLQDIIQPERKRVLTNNSQNTITLTRPKSRCLIVGCSYTF